MESSEVKIALAALNSAYKSIEERKLEIEEKRIKMRALKPAVDDYKVLDKEVKELLDSINKDRNYISSTIEFYEKHSGENVEVGDLFMQEDELKPELTEESE